MVVATITEAKNGLSALVDQVRAGESVLIMDRGTPVARLESAISASPDAEGGSRGLSVREQSGRLASHP